MHRYFLPVALILAITHGAAQAMDQPDDPGGIRIGRLLATPSLEAGARHDSNIFQSDANPTSDVITTLTPRLTLQGDWRVFHLHLSAGGELGFLPTLRPTIIRMPLSRLPAVSNWAPLR